MKGLKLLKTPLGFWTIWLDVDLKLQANKKGKILNSANIAVTPGILESAKTAISILPINKVSV